MEIPVRKAAENSPPRLQKLAPMALSREQSEGLACLYTALEGRPIRFGGRDRLVSSAADVVRWICEQAAEAAHEAAAGGLTANVGAPAEAPTKKKRGRPRKKAAGG